MRVGHLWCAVFGSIYGPLKGGDTILVHYHISYGMIGGQCDI
jgi:hypothetical protein